MVHQKWSLAVYQSCLAEADMLTNEFNRKSLLSNHLKTIINLTNSKAHKPEQSVSAVLQELRDYGFIEFVSAGKYRMVKKDIDLALFNTKKISRGEKLVAGILDEFGIQYKYESTHADLKYRGYLRFDFEINYYNRKFVIEVDGVQHERPIEYFGGLEAFKRLKKCDQIKDEYCQTTNRKMIRIKASQLKYTTVRKIISEEILEIN